MNRRLSGGGHSRRTGDTLPAYLFITPFLISFLVFSVFPGVYSLILSFFQYKGYGTARFIGFSNYTRLLTYPLFWSSVWNTLFYLIAHTIPVMIIAFLLAVAMRSKLAQWQKLYKPLIYLPQVMAAVSAALVWRVILARRSGVVNGLLHTQIAFLEDPHWMKWSVVAMLVWRAVGWYFVIFLAGLTSISKEIDEAADIDGATPFQRMLYVTIPLMKPIFLFTFVMDVITSLKIFAEPNLLVSGWLNAPPEAMPIMNLLLQNIGNGNFGMASAVGWVLFVLILGASAAHFWLFREETGDR